MKGKDGVVLLYCPINDVCIPSEREVFISPVVEGSVLLGSLTVQIPGGRLAFVMWQCSCLSNT